MYRECKLAILILLLWWGTMNVQKRSLHILARVRINLKFQWGGEEWLRNA